MKRNQCEEKSKNQTRGIMLHSHGETKWYHRNRKEKA